MPAVLIAPSILSADFSRLGEQVAQAEAAGADRIHLDVMDGHFVPNISFGPVVLQSLRKVAKTPLEVHLMIENADRYLEAFAAAGAATQIVHVEACPHLHRTLQRIRDLGQKVGLCFNPATPLHVLEEVVDELDLVLLMSVNPGFAGQRFIGSTLPKLTRAREIIQRRKPTVELEVDGGVDSQWAGPATRAGANVLVAASAIFNHPKGIAAGLSELRNAAHS